jgi:hypothetical protein
MLSTDTQPTEYSSKLSSISSNTKELIRSDMNSRGLSGNSPSMEKRTKLEDPDKKLMVSTCLIA